MLSTDWGSPPIAMGSMRRFPDELYGRGYIRLELV